MQRAFTLASAIASSSEPAVSTPSARHAPSRVTTTFGRPGSGLPMLSKVLRPITTGLPSVVALKYFNSAGIRQGI
ncbi:hypothetical protein D3C83_162690 [compost metagenome]